MVLFSIEQQLRDNEKQVWQRLIRVLNHEVRNSLTPIYSMSQSLQEMKLTGPLSAEQQVVENNILQVIEKRSLQLLDFVENYSAFNKLAPASMLAITSNDINQRIQAIFPKLYIESVNNFKFHADIGQLEQVLINLIKNAFEANQAQTSYLQSSPEQLNKDHLSQALKVIMHWRQDSRHTIIEIIDSGTGISNKDNIFVPFYTTKEQGTGIGLVLSREFIRNQRGELTLTNRDGQQGAIARIVFPLEH